MKTPPYSKPYAHKLLADFEYAVREHEKIGGAPVIDRENINKFYEEERSKMVQRLTMEISE